jgi:hypothetical protein
LFQTANSVITHVVKCSGSTLKHSRESASEEMRFLVRFVPLEALHVGLLGPMRSIARSVGVEPRNPKWTSYGALELDIFCPTRADLDLFLAAASPIAKPEFVTDLNRAPEHLTDKQILARARELFDSERYWECHEVLEGLWRQKQGEEKRFLQGVILVCAAFVHHQKREESVALSVLERAARQLDFPSGECGGIDVLRIDQEVRQMLETRKFSNFTI